MRLLEWGHLNLNGSTFKDVSSFRGVCVHVFLFVYLKRGCLGFLRNAECVISLPRLWRMPRGTRWPWRTAVHVYSPSWPSRLQTVVGGGGGDGHEQSTTCHISRTSNCLQLWVTVWVGFSSRPSLCARHAELFPPRHVWEQSFPAFVCIAVRLSELTVMMSSHPRAAICMCVWSLLPSSVFHAIVTEAPTFDI